MATEADVREMLIQHILTEDIFAHVFKVTQFHCENNIARQLYALETASPTTKSGSSTRSAA